MQFLKDHTQGAHLITGLDDHAVRIDDEVFRHSLILCATRIISPWPVREVGMLGDAAWEPVISTEPELILLGTGATLVFPQPHQMQPTLARHIGVEVMSTEAACRTYNLLVHEGRKVTAALIFTSS